MTTPNEQTLDRIDAPPRAVVPTAGSQAWPDPFVEDDDDPYINGEYEDWPSGAAMLGVP